MHIPTLSATLFAALFSLSAQAADWLYLTVPGDTLSQIGQTYLKNLRDWPRVQAVNDVAIPERLPVNTRIKIPVELLKVTPAPVTVTAVSGNVRYKSGDGAFRPLTQGAQLNGGETVLSGPRSSVAYRLADASVLTQQASSKLSFGRLAVYGKTGMVSTELSLEGGRLEAHASKQLAPAGGFKVNTPVAVAGLRGTDFRLNVSEDGKSLRNEVLQGVVAVAAQGREVSVAGGYGTVAEAGKPPQAPRPLLPAPGDTDLPARIERVPLAFSWQALAGARAYRAQVVTDSGLVLLDDITDAPSVAWTDAPADGRYTLRLRGIDAAGLEGESRDHDFVLAARPLPPDLLAPTLGERVYRNEVVCSWNAPAEAQGYLLQFSQTPDFAHGLIERRLPAVTSHAETLVDGDWHWRAASLDAAGKPRAWSPHRAFRVQPLPNPPDARASAADGQVRLAWSAAGSAVRYGLELSATAELVDPLKQETAATSLALALRYGKYFWHMRGIEGDGQVGPWSAVGTVIVPPEAPREVAIEVGGGPIQVSWKGEATAYRLELSSEPGFASALSLQVGETHAALPRPAAGDYWLRVRGVGAEGVEGQASAPLALKVEAYRPWWLLLPLLLVH